MLNRWDPFLVLFPASRMSLDNWYDYLRYCYCSVYCLDRKQGHTAFTMKQEMGMTFRLM